MKESRIQSKIVKELNSWPFTVARVLHGSAYAVTGDPDIYGTHYGQMFVIETKTPVGRLSEIQEYRLDEWEAAGARAIVATGMHEIKTRITGFRTSWRGYAQPTD